MVRVQKQNANYIGIASSTHALFPCRTVFTHEQMEAFHCELENICGIPCHVARQPCLLCAILRPGAQDPCPKHLPVGTQIHRFAAAGRGCIGKCHVCKHQVHLRHLLKSSAMSTCRSFHKPGSKRALQKSQNQGWTLSKNEFGSPKRRPTPDCRQNCFVCRGLCDSRIFYDQRAVAQAKQKQPGDAQAHPGGVSSTSMLLHNIHCLFDILC